jgi:8-amino-7-oxononanoate synthase
LLKVAAPPYLYSGPSPVASLATVLAGFKLNEQRGDAIRKQLHRKTAVILECLQHLDVHTPNESGFPIIEIQLAEPDWIKEVGNYLFDRGIYVTMAAYPLVPRHEVGFRIQVTAANSDAEIAQLIETLHAVSRRFPLQRVSGSRVPRRSQSHVLKVI